MHKSTGARLFCALALFGTGLAANAVPVTYIGADNSVSTLDEMINSQSALAEFLAVAGDLNVVDFESAPPSSLSITGGTITDNSGCGALCGFNTTPGGAFFVYVFGGSVTFTFSDPVDAFGFFVNGLQTDIVPQQTIVYVDGAGDTQVINMPAATGGGGAFLGFIDFGQLISSVTFNATNDILAFDDLRFGRSATDPGNGDPPTSVPEPATLSLLGLGLLGIGVTRRRRRTA